MKEVLKSIRDDYFSFFAVGFLIAVTANTFFYTTIQPIILGCLIYGFIFIKRGLKLDTKFHTILIIITILLLGQAFMNNSFQAFTLIGIYIRFLLAYFIIRLVNKNFFTQYVNFVYLFAVIGVIIYLLFTFFPTLISFCESNITPYVQPPFQGNEVRKHIIIYDYSNLIYTRFSNFGLNAGFYWEPGAQAIFCVFAIIFHSFSTKKFTNKINLTLIFVLLTTFSTTGYLSLIIFALLFYIVFSNNKFITLILSSIFGVFLYSFIFSEIPFLKTKIEEDISFISSKHNEGSRFQSFYLDYLTAVESPLFGKDIYVSETGETIERNTENHRNNGIGIILGTYGFVALFLYLLVTYWGIKKLSISWELPVGASLVMLFMFIFLNFGMPLTLRPFFYGMLMLYVLPANFKKTLT